MLLSFAGVKGLSAALSDAWQHGPNLPRLWGTLAKKYTARPLSKSTPHHKPAILNNLFLASNHETSHLLRISSSSIQLTVLYFSWI